MAEQFPPESYSKCIFWPNDFSFETNNVIPSVSKQPVQRWQIVSLGKYHILYYKFNPSRQILTLTRSPKIAQFKWHFSQQLIFFA